MQLMTQLMRDHAAISADDEDFLFRLVAEWQLVADLSFSDLVLWVPDRDPNIFWAVAQIRPTTGPTALDDDVAGDRIAYHPEHGVPEAYLTGVMVETSENKLQAGVPVDVHAIPIMRDGRVVAVVERHTNQMGVRAPGSLEDTYLEIAEMLTEMLCRGQFPVPGTPSDPVMSPRVGDGMIRLDAHLNVMYATPNAVTAYRRMGLAADLEDENLPAITRSLQVPVDWETETPDPLDEAFALGEATEIEISVGMISIRLRLLPLTDGAEPAGVVVLCRDVTELTKRERQLVTKDATIREIHHRVKNNLQTVAALLRMQARRIPSPEARSALTEAVSRVAAIAVVHETLSQSYDDAVEFDEVADRVLKMLGGLALTRGDAVSARREGSFGLVPAEVATSLSLVVTELCQNAMEHGLVESHHGLLRVVPRVVGNQLRVQVIDDGIGLPPDFSLETSGSLGLSIVATLMSDLGGTFQLANNPDGPGSCAEISLPLHPAGTAELRG
ncbi:MAG: sensor histidine kinase [Propionibacteriaceae bacterium]|nr:sensor histidine kinase [Propionibacteriaceae bacterium]